MRDEVGEMAVMTWVMMIMMLIVVTADMCAYSVAGRI